MKRSFTGTVKLSKRPWVALHQRLSTVLAIKIDCKKKTIRPKYFLRKIISQKKKEKIQRYRQLCNMANLRLLVVVKEWYFVTKIVLNYCEKKKI